MMRADGYRFYNDYARRRRSCIIIISLPRCNKHLPYYHPDEKCKLPERLQPRPCSTSAIYRFYNCIAGPASQSRFPADGKLTFRFVFIDLL